MTLIHGGLPLRAFESLRRWQRRRQAIAGRRRAIAELESLDDRVLQDIGVVRNSIPELVDTMAEDEAGASDPRPGFATRPCTQPC